MWAGCLCLSRPYPHLIRPTFRVVNMGLAVMMAFSAVNGILKIADFALADFFVALYMMYVVVS